MASLKLTALLLAAASLLPAASIHDWENVEKIKSGRDLLIVRSDGKRVEGSLLTAGPMGVTLDTRSGQVEIPKDTIFRVSTAPKRRRNAIIGAAILGAPAAFVGHYGRIWANNESANGDLFLASALAIGIGAGAGIGAASGAPQTIYRSLKP